MAITATVQVQEFGTFPWQLWGMLHQQMIYVEG
jgi:hypothetical protein